MHFSVDAIQITSENVSEIYTILSRHPKVARFDIGSEKGNYALRVNIWEHDEDNEWEIYAGEWLVYRDSDRMMPILGSWS